MDRLRSSLPRLELGRDETPVRELAALSGEGAARSLWIKNDGLYGGRWGGNKARKLEYLLADALRRGKSTVLTGGALGTNHGLATALYAKEQGLRTVLLLVPQPIDDHVRRQLARMEGSGARIYRPGGTLRALALVPWVMLANADLRRRTLPYFLTVGGSSALGSVGYVAAGLELGRQVRAGLLPEPSHVVVTVGTGGTAAGLLAGLRLAGLRSRLVGIVVQDRVPVGARAIARKARRTVRLLRRHGLDVAPVALSAAGVELHDRWLGAGYGHRTAAAEEAAALMREREGIELDPVYTAKAVAGLLALDAEGAFGRGPVLYWHTYHAMPERDMSA